MEKRDKCRQESQLIVQEMDNLGFTINESKSVLTPTQRLEFFGVIIDTVLFKVFLTEEKIQKILSMCSTFLISKIISIRQLSSFIGLCVHAFNAITLAPLHYRSLERDKVFNLATANNNYDALMTLSKESITEITWWFENVRTLNGKPIRMGPVDFYLETDASNDGWGAHFNGTHAGGRWSALESTNHINYLELLAIFLALKVFFSNNTTNYHICIKSDNSSAVAYINNMGGMCSKSMDTLSINIWNWCTSHQIYISAQYLPGILNIHADLMSRKFVDSCEWSLKDAIFHRICNQFFTPDIDLFASRLNNKSETFVSWSFDPEASYTDAFSISWENFEPYIFPPFCLIAKILNKIREDKVKRAIMIVPFWPTQTWFSMLISALISLPVRLPRHRDLLTVPHTGANHPLSRKMNLIACVVSGLPCVKKDFLHQMPSSSHLLGGNQLINNTSYVGKNGLFGVNSGKLIHFIRLK